MYSVFLVEDEKIIREGIKRLLPWEESGFRFIGEAPDGELAWAQIREKKPDVVITDIKMPFMDGLSLSRLIKKNFPATTVIILSGYDEFHFAQEALDIGVSKYILKPVSRDKMRELLTEIKKDKDEKIAEERVRQKLESVISEYLATFRGEQAAPADDPAGKTGEKQAAQIADETIDKACAFIRTRYAEPGINLDAAAAHVSLAPSYFSALFSQRVKKTFIAYLTECRMEKARELLLSTNIPSGEIALAVGYNDPHYFSFLFKRNNGCSPTEYRNRAREAEN